MDFFSYLQNSGKQKQTTNELNESNQPNSQNNLKNELDHNHIINYNFKKGEFVMINKYENSKFNMYKGYLAEIKEFRKNTDHAYVILPALSYPRLMKIPINHFKKINKN